jgi:acyl carrier protein
MNHRLSREEIVGRLSEVLGDIVADWDLELDERITQGTRIVADLGFESVDIMQLIVAIEQTFGRRSLPFEEILMEEGGYVNEITVGVLADFLLRHLEGPRT